MVSKDAKDMTSIDLRVPEDHAVMQLRDHHIMNYLRAQASDTDLGTIKIPLPAIERLWQNAYELGFECGAHVVHVAKDTVEAAKTKKGKV